MKLNEQMKVDIREAEFGQQVGQSMLHFCLFRVEKAFNSGGFSADFCVRGTPPLRE